MRAMPVGVEFAALERVKGRHLLVEAAIRHVVPNKIE